MRDALARSGEPSAADQQPTDAQEVPHAHH
jgi:hypothetical protein